MLREPDLDQRDEPSLQSPHECPEGRVTETGSRREDDASMTDRRFGSTALSLFIVLAARRLKQCTAGQPGAHPDTAPALRSDTSTVPHRDVRTERKYVSPNVSVVLQEARCDCNGVWYVCSSVPLSVRGVFKQTGRCRARCVFLRTRVCLHE